MNIIKLMLLSMLSSSLVVAEPSKLEDASNAFAIDLLKELSIVEKGNIIFSPYSVSAALAMTYVGAAGKTAEELGSALHLSNVQRPYEEFQSLAATLDASQSNAITLQIANSIWPQQGYPLRPSYVDLVKKYFAVELTPLDFLEAVEEARKIINQWVANKTNELIKEILPPNVLDAATRLALVNAIYFKGNWETPFNPAGTKSDKFFLSRDLSEDVLLMTLRSEFTYLEDERAQYLELPYEGGDFSMFVVLPRAERTLSEYIKDLTVDEIASKATQGKKQKVLVSLPNFTLNYGTKLNEALKALGIQSAFDNANADFSGISEKNDLFIGSVFHKAFIEVNEKGSEAAASTAIVMQERSAKPNFATFRADRPFLFLIRHNSSSAVLFVGTFVDPS